MFRYSEFHFSVNWTHKMYVCYVKQSFVVSVWIVYILYNYYTLGLLIENETSSVLLYTTFLILHNVDPNQHRKERLLIKHFD